MIAPELHTILHCWKYGHSQENKEDIQGASGSPGSQSKAYFTGYINFLRAREFVKECIWENKYMFSFKQILKLSTTKHLSLLCLFYYPDQLHKHDCGI